MFLKAIRGFISVSRRRELSTLLEFFNLVQHENQWRNSHFYYLRQNHRTSWDYGSRGYRFDSCRARHMPFLEPFRTYTRGCLNIPQSFNHDLRRLILLYSIPQYCPLVNFLPCWSSVYSLSEIFPLTTGPPSAVFLPVVDRFRVMFRVCPLPLLDFFTQTENWARV